EDPEPVSDDYALGSRPAAASPACELGWNRGWNSIDYCGRHAGSFASPSPFHLRDFGSRDFALTLGAPAGYQDHGGGGEEAENRQPPNLPDQREAHDRREEGDDETGRAVVRHFDRFIGRFDRRPPDALHVPERVDGLDPGQHRKIVGRRRRV